jgi:hypothetical protein
MFRCSYFNTGDYKYTNRNSNSGPQLTGQRWHNRALNSRLLKEQFVSVMLDTDLGSRESK